MRSAALSAGRVGDRSGCFGGCGGGRAREVATPQAVAVAFEREDIGVMNEPVDYRGGGDLVADDLAQPENGLCLVTISEARS